MSENLIMSFPILQSGCADFVEEVNYEVEATHEDKKITIVHTLSGQSYINQFLQNGEALFSVQLLYRDSSERQYVACKTTDIQQEVGKITAVQIIEITFLYAPEINPYIVILDDTVIVPTDKASGLNEFWHQSRDINIPKFSRIALSPKITFTGDGATGLFQIKLEEDYADGEMEVIVYEHAKGREVPVTLLCSQDVYDFLDKLSTTEPNTLPEPTTPSELLTFAIITNALCALYTYMQNVYESNKEYEESGVLFDHLNRLQDETGTDWQEESFSPSLAATKVLPYKLDLKILNGESEDE